MTVLDRPVRADSGPDTPLQARPARRRSRWRTAARIAIAAEGAGLAAVVALHGTPAFRVARALLVVGLTATLLLLEGRDRRWWPGVRMALVGFVGIVVGAGVGAVHVLKGGDAATTIGGLVVLAAGVVLMASGAAILVRRARGWWRLLAVPIAYVVLEFGMIPIAMGIAGTNVPQSALGDRTPASYGLTYETVALRATDGIALSGWYVPSGNGAAVVVVAGSGSGRDAVLEQGSVLAQHGYGVLFLDNRGHGSSAGNANDFGWYGNQDIGGAVSWLEARSDVHGGRIAVVGESMGGEEAIGAMGADPRIRAVVGEGVTGRVLADRAWLAHDVTGYMMRVEAWMTYTTADLLSGASEPPGLRESLRSAAPRPVLLIAGRDELRADRYYQETAPGNVQLLELPHSAHTLGLQTQRMLWTQRVVAFLDDALDVVR